ncbi:hypothetical protein Tco_0189836 [Tanacetum coccineum]
MNEDKIKKDLEEIETINIELDHRVSKLIAENEHLKQTYKQLYDSIKPARILDGFQDLLTIISKTCPRPITSGEKKVQEIKFRNNRKGVYKYWIHLETYWSDLHHSRKLACPLTRITTTTEVPFRNLTALENETSKPVVTLIYLRKPRKSKTNVPVSKTKVLKSLSANNKEPSQSWGSIVSNVPSSLFDGCSGGGSNSKLFSSI